MESSRSRKRTRQAYDDPDAPLPEREVVGPALLVCAHGVWGCADADSVTPWTQVPRCGASPPWREDDRDGHYVFDLGENLTRRCEHPTLRSLSEILKSLCADNVCYVISGDVYLLFCLYVLFDWPLILLGSW